MLIRENVGGLPETQIARSDRPGRKNSGYYAEGEKVYTERYPEQNQPRYRVQPICPVRLSDDNGVLGDGHRANALLPCSVHFLWSWACIRGGTQRGPAPSTDLSIVKIVVTACRASHIVHRAHRCPARFTECSFFTRSSSTVSTILCCGHDTFPLVISSPISVRTNVPLWQYRLGAERGC